MKNLVDGIHWIWKGHSSTSATVQTMLTRVFILATNIATGIITARALGPEGRGEQAAIILWPQFLAYAMTLGIPVALVYNLKRYPEEETDLFSAALVLGTGLGMLATLTGVVFIPIWLAQYSTEVIHLAQAFMIFAPLSLLSVIFTGALEARHNFTASNQVRYLSPLVTLTILSALALLHQVTPFSAGLAYMVPALPIFSWTLVRLWKCYHPRWHSLGKSYKRLLGYGLRSYGIDLLSTLAAQVDQVLVVGLLAPASMGMYVVALSLSRILNLFQSAIVTVLLPKASARPVTEVVELTGRAARTSTALTLLAAIGVMILGPVLLRLLYGSEYVGAVPVFRILVIEVLIGGITWVLAQAFMALGRPGTVSVLQGIGLGLSVPLMLLLIPTYGLLGAGIALLCSTTTRLIFMLVCYPLFLKVRPPSLIITQKDWHFIKQIFKSK